MASSHMKCSISIDKEFLNRQNKPIVIQSKSTFTWVSVWGGMTTNKYMGTLQIVLMFYILTGVICVLTYITTCVCIHIC